MQKQQYKRIRNQERESISRGLAQKKYIQVQRNSYNGSKIG
jgi:hypothetical protein